MIRMSRMAWLVVVWVCALVVYAPAASYGQAGGEAEKSLLARANEYWQYKMQGDLEKCYALEETGSVKDVTLADYARSVGSGVKWLKAEAAKAQIKEDKGSVLMRIRYVWTFVADNPKDGFEGTFVEQWKNVNGSWYHVYRKPTYGKMMQPGDADKNAPQAGPGNAAGQGAADNVGGQGASGSAVEQAPANSAGQGAAGSGEQAAPGNTGTQEKEKAEPSKDAGGGDGTVKKE